MSVVGELVRQALAKGKKLSCFRVVTGSMAPLIPVGGTIDVVPLPPGGVRALKTFDIVLTEHDDKLFCHYLAWVNELPEPDGSVLCVTRGLNHWDEDVPVPDSQVLGLVASHKVPARYRVKVVVQIAREALAERFFKIFERKSREKETPPLP